MDGSRQTEELNTQTQTLDSLEHSQNVCLGARGSNHMHNILFLFSGHRSGHRPGHRSPARSPVRSPARSPARSPVTGPARSRSGLRPGHRSGHRPGPVMIRSPVRSAARLRPGLRPGHRPPNAGHRTCNQSTTFLFHATFFLKLYPCIAHKRVSEVGIGMTTPFSKFYPCIAHTKG